MYNVISMFRTSGYTIATHGYNCYVQGAQYRAKNYKTQFGGIDDRSDTLILPCGGAPMRAKDTLLAQLLRNSRTAGALLSGKFELDDYDNTRISIRNAKRLFRSDDEAPRASGLSKILAMPHLRGRLVSVEIEYYPQTTCPSNALTNITTDGSLGSGGREIRRLTWADENGRLNGLLSLAKHMKGARVDKSCGLHVHVDVRHLPQPGCGTPQICDAAEVYDRLTQFYPMLKKIIPRSRWNNKYCMFYNNRDGSEHYRRPRQGQRYAAINWCSYYEHNTIEFRLAAGSTNMVKIESWALLCRFLVSWCSVRSNSIPTTWNQFLVILPAWLASWCILRNMKLHGGLGALDSRVASAADVSIPTESSNVE